jgi:uncharacterized repeat protein (TIGR03803 family)
MTQKGIFLSRILPFLAVAAVVSLTPDYARAGNELTLHSFSPQERGSFPGGGVIADAAGNLYGEARNGGAYGSGVIFELSPNQQVGWNEKILYSFKDGNDGADPQGGLIFDAAGNLYGLTTYGGLGYGTIFELEHNPDGSWTEKTLHSIDEGQPTNSFQSGLVLDQNGNLYGVGTGGLEAAGIVYELSPSSNGEWQETVLHSFSWSGSGGNTPIGPLVVDLSGNVFGVANMGGNGCAYPGCGLVFELSPTSGGKWNETVLHQFDGGTDGEYPSGGLISDGAGNLYGTTFSGGAGSGSSCYGCGTVFEFTSGSKGQWKKTVLYNFQGNADGENPAYKLTFDRSGDLYGVTYGGGGLGFCDLGGCGTVFELTPNSAGQWSENVLGRFNNDTNGYNPNSSVFVSADGQVFGETGDGVGLGQNGTVFVLTPNGGQWKLTLVSGFVDSDGDWPLAELVADSTGHLYGTTAGGGVFGLGAVFQLTTSVGNSWQEKIIYSFSTGSERTCCLSDTLPSPLITDAAGNLYGEIQGGGRFNSGLVYELSPAAGGIWIARSLYVFKGGVNGSNPIGGLVMDKVGHLFGVTDFGGQSGDGVVFELTPEANGLWSEETLYQFGGPPSDGAHPQAALILDQAGNLYGTSEYGGTGPCTHSESPTTVVGCGTAFELARDAGIWSEKNLYSFLGLPQDGQFPHASLVPDKSGNLFGTTTSGGSGQESSCAVACGTVFKLSPTSGGGWTESVIYNFPDPSGGIIPLGTLITDGAGNLYGTTSASSNCFEGLCGTVFELSPNSSGGWNDTLLYAFTDTGTDGGNPSAGVIFGPNQYLYGTTRNGGAQTVGAVFAITP